MRKKKYCKLKIAGKKKKPTLHFIWDKLDKQVLEFRLKNIYESFSKDFLEYFIN